MKAGDHYDWEHAIGMPTAKECKEFCDKADDFLRRRGHYVGPMRSIRFSTKPPSKDYAHNENIVDSN